MDRSSNRHGIGSVTSTNSNLLLPSSDLMNESETGIRGGSGAPAEIAEKVNDGGSRREGRGCVCARRRRS